MMDAGAKEDLDRLDKDSGRELLHALECGLSESQAAQRARLRNAPDVFAARERVESILGFGTSSPM